MGAFTAVTEVRTELLGSIKKSIVTAVAPASYDAGGSLVDLSSIFPSKVYGAKVIGVSPHGSAKYLPSFIPGASSGPALGKIKLHDVTAVSGAEASGDLSATTLTLEVTGA